MEIGVSMTIYLRASGNKIAADQNFALNLCTEQISDG
jgi:hypothetical protein